MAKYLIKGGNRLEGVIPIQGAKNAVLPIIAASIITEGVTTIENVPRLKDVDNMLKILNAIGVKTDQDGNRITVDAREITSYEIPSQLAKELRSSIFLLGPLLQRVGKAKVAYPGGCDIGLRPIDLHIKALREMGVEIKEECGYVYCDAKNKERCAITLDYPSVGATENALLLATGISGTTTILNAATEPEIEDLARFINAMGGRIEGAGTPLIKVQGVISLKGASFSVMPDRIEAGTYLIGGLICGCDLLLDGAKEEHLSSLLSKFSKWDCKITTSSDKIHITSNGRRGELGVIETKPYPGFPTDLQAEICALASVSKGATIIVENLFETRFKHLPELVKMGARVKVKDRVAVISGVERLNGAEVYAKDLRGGASLVIAGLGAIGTTVVRDVEYVERGYENLVEKLRRVGGNIEKIH